MHGSRSVALEDNVIGVFLMLGDIKINLSVLVINIYHDIPVYSNWQLHLVTLCVSIIIARHINATKLI